MAEFFILLRILATSVLRAFFPALFAEVKTSFRDTAEDAMPQPELKARLQKSIRAKWGRVGVVGLLLASCVLLGGCGTRVVFIPAAAEPVRLRADIKKAKVWVMGADGQPVAATCTLPQGWFVLSDPGVDEKPESEKPAADAPPAIPTVNALPALKPGVVLPANF